MPAPSGPRAVLEYPHRVAFSIQVGRNLVLQGLGTAMVTLMGLSVLPVAAVLIWTLAIVAVFVAEHHVLRLISRPDNEPKAALRLAPLLRFASTTLYALAALALIVKGGPGERLFAFALMGASVINVLMRYYRAPKILLLSLSPYIAILAAVAVQQGQAQWRQGDMLGVVASGFTLGLFALQLWSARAQLAGAWDELTAREHAADAANRAKSQFLATMSHELRTPLNAVLGMSQALAADPLAATQRERVKVIRRSSETLLAVLNDLLDLSKIESGALTLELVEFDLEHLMRGVAAAFQPQAEKQGLAFELGVTDEAAGFYRGDSARLRRILYSLCDNAVKFTATGGIALKVDRAAEQLIFTVADTGIGIGENDLPHLFEGFFQADATFTRRYGGAGLGLAICSELTSLMDGTIEASSQLDKGSTFTVRLPLQRMEPVATEAPPQTPYQIESAGDLRVLAAEDNATNRLVLKSLLAVAGIQPTFANDGQEAVEAWEAQPWDLVLMDIQMPRMNGIDAARSIRSCELETGRPRTPIIAVTANAMTDQVAEYLAAGMDHVVAKPVDLSALLGAMEQALASAEVPAMESNRRPTRGRARARS